MAKRRAQSKPLSEILAAGKKPVDVVVETAGGDSFTVTLRKPSAAERTALYEEMSGLTDGDDPSVPELMSHAARALKSAYDGEITEEEAGELLVDAGGLGSDLFETANRLCGLGGRRDKRGRGSALPTG